MATYAYRAERGHKYCRTDLTRRTKEPTQLLVIRIERQAFSSRENNKDNRGRNLRLIGPFAIGNNFTSKAYEKIEDKDGYKVVYTPLIQAPAECPSTISRIIRQRIRWAEGHTFNVKKYFGKVLMSPRVSLMEKGEFIFHYSLYYLQSLLFCLGTAFWILSEIVRTYAPFSSWWTPQFGWTLVLINLFSLPIMGLTGLFLEKSMRGNITGVISFVLMSYILAPFQAYASLKGLFEKKEGSWVRTYKTGKVTERIMTFRLRRILRAIVPKKMKGG